MTKNETKKVQKMIAMASGMSVSRANIDTLKEILNFLMEELSDNRNPERTLIDLTDLLMERSIQNIVAERAVQMYMEDWFEKHSDLEEDFWSTFTNNVADEILSDENLEKAKKKVKEEKSAVFEKMERIRGSFRAMAKMMVPDDDDDKPYDDEEDGDDGEKCKGTMDGASLSRWLALYEAQTLSQSEIMAVEEFMKFLKENGVFDRMTKGDKMMIEAKAEMLKNRGDRLFKTCKSRVRTLITNDHHLQEFLDDVYVENEDFEDEKRKTIAEFSGRA